MKKNILNLLISLIAVIFIFTGCSSENRDFKLARSKGITVKYINEFENFHIRTVSLTSDEIFNIYGNTIVRGMIETVRNIQIDYGKGEIAQKALVTIKITKVISGNATENSIVTVLLPYCVDDALANDSSPIMFHFGKGKEGIFLLSKVKEDSRAEMGGKIFYYSDVCEYFIFGDEYFAIIESGGKIRFSASIFDCEINAFATLDEAEAKIKSVISKK